MKIVVTTPTGHMGSRVVQLVVQAGMRPTVTTLLGDAAHGMAPNLGRGACEALLDAVALVGALTEASGVDAALHAYDAGRRRRGDRMVRAARLLNRASTAKRFTAARNLAVSAAARFS